MWKYRNVPLRLSELSPVTSTQNVTLMHCPIQARAEVPAVLDAIRDGHARSGARRRRPRLGSRRRRLARGAGGAGRCATFVADSSDSDDSCEARTSCAFGGDASVSRTECWMSAVVALGASRVPAPCAPCVQAWWSSGRAVMVGATAARRERALRRWPATPGRGTRQARAAGRRRRRACRGARNGGGPRSFGWIVCPGNRRGGLACGVVGVVTGGVGW